MRSFLALGPLVVVALTAACSNSAQQTSGVGGSSGTTGSSSSSGTFDAGGVVQTYMTGEGPIMLAPGQEVTNCIVIPLGNTDGGFVRRFRADLSEGSHHMIVYTVPAGTAVSSTPTPCQPFAGILSGAQPVFIAQQAHAELDFPTAADGTPVGFQIQPNQLVKVEFHTINTTQTPLSVTGTAYLDAIPLTSNVTASDIAFWGTEKIAIAGNSSFDTTPMGGPPLFQQALPGTKSFAVTTHQHHLGTEMKVWYSAAQGDTSDLVADGTDWSNPPLVMLDPPLDFPAGGTKGMSYECHWINPTGSLVLFGEGFNNEMCFLWHYYYPGQGFQFCTDGKCK